MVDIALHTILLEDINQSTDTDSDDAASRSH